MDFSSLNYLAILIAALSTFLIGGVWYGPLFGKQWMIENGFSADQAAGGSPLIKFGGTFLLAFLSALNLALMLGANADLSFGVFAGLMTGLFFVSTFFGIIYLFERRSLKLFLINAGYITLAFTVMGAILGAF